MKKYYLSIILSLVGATAFASHLIGGQIYWDALGNNQYNITLQLIRDYSGAGLNSTIQIETNIAGMPTITLDSRTIHRLSDACFNNSTRQYELYTYTNSSPITLSVVPSAVAPLEFHFSLCCLPEDSAINLSNPADKYFYINSKMYGDGVNMNSPRFDLRTIFAQKFNRNLTLLPISKNGLDVGLELVPIFDEFGQPYAYRNGYSGTYPTSPNDTLLPSGHFVSGNTDSAGFAYLSVLAHEKFGPGQRLSDVKLSVGYSFDVFQSNQDPLFEIVNSNVSYSFVDTSLIRIDVSRGQQVDLRIRGSVRLDSAAGPTPISANLSSQSISSLSIPQPSLQPIRTFGTLSGQDTVEFDFSWLVPTGLPVGRHRMIANITDENCPINGMTSRIIEFVNDGNYMFKYSLCQGDSIQLIAPVNANLYSWYPQSNISNSTSSQPFVFPTGHTVYKLIADGDTVATYNILIDKTVKPSVTLNSNNQVELMNPQDYSTHQMFFFYYPMAKDDTFYTPSEAGLYHISGGQSNCIQYSDSLEYRPTILQSVSMMDDFMDESMLTSLGPNDYLRVVTHFNGSQYPTRLTKLIIPGGYISPGSSVELVYNNTNIPSVTIYPQPGPHNSLEFNLNPPLRAVDTGATFQFNVLTGTLLLPVRYSSTELSHPKITRVYSLLHFDQSADRTYPQVPLVFQGTGPVSLDEHESLFSIYPQPADQFLEIEGVDQHVDCLLIDLNGRILLEEETENGVLDVSQVNSGIYILQLHDDRGSSSHKVIVQH